MVQVRSHGRNFSEMLKNSYKCRIIYLTDGIFENIPDPFEATCPIERPLITEHHVLWSMSYSVPVLYFNGWKSDFPGINSISMEEAQSFVCDRELKYKDLSQAIHPILGTPFLYLHPCMSHELLQITSKSKNKLVSWLSTVAPAALNLKLRPEYYQLTI
ncbi:ubiquitin-like-conjugating enzyme ATG10 isoform X6 [Apis mellifera]|uniref:Ubiquitin-like-conjugating enzyme ATG10 n=1 Tax=Apis mellifera TaxID=7460 RepID=A0A7M7GZ13_APIME|nr:ubiquitin-like-conjugating enzyme ATG10 isoform X6 [Apis mellifera]|eukprot:XP_006566643.1 ubiquitin-like-conjugating enzyme ATG10 isoform X6 [Apis mellifera]